MSFCPNCGAERRHPNARFCHKCGYAFKGAPISPTKPRSRQRRSRASIVIGGLVLTITAIAAVLAFGPGNLLVERLFPVETVISSVEKPVDTGTPAKVSPTETATPSPVNSPEPTETSTPSSVPTETPVPTSPPPPTATPVPTATPLPTATPVPIEPPQETDRQLGYYPIPIGDQANANTTEGYVDPPLGSVQLNDVSFDLDQGKSITTQANPLPNNPTNLSFAVDLANPQAVYLLITAGDLYNKFSDKKLGEVRLRFSNGDTHVIALVAGNNIREWKHYQDNVVSTTTNPLVTEVWSGSNNDDTGTAVIDMLHIDVPQAYRTQSLTAIEILDLSQEIVGEMDPAINLLGITIAVMQDVAPEQAPPPPPPSLSCNIQPPGEFDTAWQQHQSLLGCPTNNAVETGGATQPFEHGRMIWRKNMDWHYVLFDDGTWQNFKDKYEEGMTEPDVYQPPAGLVTPVRGFGLVWRNHLGGPQSAIGWGLKDEYWSPFQVQDFEKGLSIELEGQMYILGNNGELWLNP